MGRIVNGKRKRKGNGKMNNIRESHIGEQKIANCGDLMTIVEFFSSTNITVMFSDGAIAKKKHYDNFLAGKIMNPNRRNHVGESRMAVCGMMMTIVACRTAKDCDIRFADGTMRYNMSYHNFKKGAIGYPQEEVNHVGEVRTANNGMEMRIIEYVNYRNITVEFADGTIRKNCAYESFLKGSIANPNVVSVRQSSLEEATYLYYLKKIGFERKARGYFKKFSSAWSNRELDMFNEELMIGLEYDGYYWHKDSVKKDIAKDKLCFDCCIDLIRIRAMDREKMLPLLNSGMSYEVLCDPKTTESIEQAIINVIMYINMKYNKTFSIDVDIIRDAEKIRRFYNKMSTRQNDAHIGETAKAYNGQMMTLKEYFGWDDITVEFEDKTIRKHVNYQNFLRGDVKNPSYYHKRIGEQRKATCGMTMTIVKYNSYRDITVRFDDGTEVETIYSSFQTGNVLNPNFVPHIGEIQKAKCGMNMKVVAYRHAKDISVEFEDGTIVETTYQQFKNHQVGHPNINMNAYTKKRDFQHRIGETKIANCGMQMMIVAYRKAIDIDVRFEDGTTVTTTYGQFVNGQVRNPNFKREAA